MQQVHRILFCGEWALTCAPPEQAGGVIIDVHMLRSSIIAAEELLLPHRPVRQWSQSGSAFGQAFHGLTCAGAGQGSHLALPLLAGPACSKLLPGSSCGNLHACQHDVPDAGPTQSHRKHWA